MTGNWEEVLSAALVGTARRAGPASVSGLGDADLSSLGVPEAVLLATAGVLATRRRAGRRPGEAPRRLPPPAAPDDRPHCSKTASEVLELLLSGEVWLPGGSTPLIAQWLTGAARTDRRVPARLLPHLLDLGIAHPGLRPDLITVLGPRGRWLARHRDLWSWVAAGPDPLADPDAGAGDASADGLADADVIPEAGCRVGAATAAHQAGGGGQEGDPLDRRFATASRVERLSLLGEIRAQDPDRGRELVGLTWSKDPAADRAALLGALAAGLSAADEPFLENALDDRAAAVRATAAQLLGRLPTSRRAARMAGRLRELVTVTPAEFAGATEAPSSPGPAGPDQEGTVAGVVLAVGRLPAPAPAARRDGITDAAPSGVSKSVWWLTQIVAGTPLSFWVDHLGADPAHVVRIIATQAPDLLPGLELAVAAQSNPSPAGPASGGGAPAVPYRAGSASGGGAPAVPYRAGSASGGGAPAVLALAGSRPRGGAPADQGWALALFGVRPSAVALEALPAEVASRALQLFLAETGRHSGAVAALMAAVPGPWDAELSTTVVDRYRNLGGRAAPELAQSLPVLAERLDPSAALLNLVEAWSFGLGGNEAVRRRVSSVAHALSLRSVINQEFA